MRIAKTVTVNVRIPKFESVCREMWSEREGDFTTAEWRAVGIVKKDAIARTVADPVVREKFDLAIARLMAKKVICEYDFYAENVAFDIIDKLPKKHWISVVGDAACELHYPEGM